MKTQTKKFSKQHYNENDKIAKEKAIDFLLQIYPEFKLSKDIEQFKRCDLEFINQKSNQTILVETEIKKVWTKSGEWQGYKTLDVPYRKKDSKANLYIMFNNSLDTLAFCPMEKVLISITYQKRTIYTKWETFFAVNLKEIDFYYKNNGKWKKQFSKLPT